ncbi:D-glucuronyl C5-epimerase family protein [Brachybacterium sp. GCM10030268]
MTNEADVGLPPLQASRKAVWNYYRIEFLPNGYPGRRAGDVLQAHPIYGPYVLSDYMAQYRETGDPVFLDAVMRVADAAADQMSSVGDGALAFLYSQQGTAVSLRKETFYSGLTQARYVDSFRRLLALPGTERFHEVLSGIVASLEVPVEEGGVARYTESGGLIIEEYPSPIPDCTLNGWTTATCILGDYARRDGGDRAWSIFERSVKGLEELIPLYDVPEIANSRYRLTGTASIRVTAVGADVAVDGCEIEMPGVGVFGAASPGEPAGEALRKGPLRIRSGTTAEFAISLSRLTWPAPNRIHLDVDASAAGSVEVAIADGRYSPLANHVPVDDYRLVARHALVSGRNFLDVSIPWECAELVAYPTNFRKTLAGRQFNQYHWIHVDTLGKIVDATGSSVLAHYQQKWKLYPERWPSIPEYQDERIMLERFDAAKHK